MLIMSPGCHGDFVYQYDEILGKLISICFLSLPICLEISDHACKIIKSMPNFEIIACSKIIKLEILGKLIIK